MNAHLKNTIRIIFIYFLWIKLHYIASILYTTFCTPNTLYGFIMSPFLIMTPQCQGLRWIIYTGANTINNMWIVLGTYICTKLINLETA